MSKPGFLTTRTGGLVAVAAALTLAAACSSRSKSTTPASSGTSSPPSSSAPAATTTVGSAMASVGGTQTTVLTAPDGHTLYYFTPDSAGGQPTCTGTCATLWPPLTAASPSAASGVTGKLTVATGANGSQVIYNGHPLYEYKLDTAAGQTNGEGVMGKWHVATPGLAPGTTTMPAPSSPSTSGGGNGSGGY